MKISDFGGRSPVNRMMTGLMFACIRWRSFSLRFKNKIKSVIKKKNYALCNDNHLAAEKFKHFKNQGFDKVNIGGGDKNLKGFINVDFLSHPGVEREIQANIEDLSFIPDESLAQIHSNHVVEHISPEAFEKQLVQYFRILNPKGLLTIRCPNALGVCYGFWFGRVPEVGQEEFIGLGFPEDEDFCNPLDGWYHKNFYGFLHWIFGDVGNLANQHLNIFTPSTIKKHIVKAGFDIIKISEPESSSIILIARKG